MVDEVLKESWAYQEIRQEGVEEGLQEGIEKGRREAIQIALQKQRDLLESVVQKRFPALADAAKQRGANIDELDILQDLMSKLFSAQDEVEAKDILRD